MEFQNTRKMEVDYSSNVDALLKTVKSVAESGDLDGAIEQVLSLEKLTRGASDVVSTGRLLVALVEILAENKQWDRLNDTLKTMTKKHGQMKQAVTEMVQKAMKFIDKTETEDIKLNLIYALRTVTEGKIHVETERARLTKQLADIRESRGDIDGAATVLQELQVETFGSMEKREKTEFMLEQMRLCLARKDYIRTQIVSKKISTKLFDAGEYVDLKLKYYYLMIELDKHDRSYLNISKHYWEIYNTKSIQEDESKKIKALVNVIIYLLLAPYENEQHDLMCRRMTLKDAELVPKYLELLKVFTTEELIHWTNFCMNYKTTLKTMSDAFTSNEQCWEDLHLRVIEHNIRVIAGCYTKIRLTRLAQLLDLNLEKAEEYLSKLVVNQTVYAKIDRLEGVVHFVMKKVPTDILNDWSYNSKNLMSLIDRTTHLVNKERMVHRV